MSGTPTTRDGAGALRGEEPTRPHDSRMTRRRHTLVVVLTLVTGIADAIGFLALGGAFSSVMTGNMVLLGLAGSVGDWALARHVGLAILSFVIGVAAGTWITGKATASDGVWPRRVTAALGVEAVLLLTFLVVWEVTLADRNVLIEQLLLGLAALSLGIQSSAVQRFGVPGLSSTYLTGTLTNLVAGFAGGRPLRQQLPGLVILLALIAGAAAGGLVVTALPWLAPVLMVVLLLIVITAALFLHHQ